jgi:hypothetical protein
MFHKVESPEMLKEYIDIKNKIKDDQSEKKENEENKNDSKSITTNDKENITKNETCLDTFTKDLKETLDQKLVLRVSSIVSKYLQNSKTSKHYERSKAGYSLRYDSKNQKYTIGNKDVLFENDKIKIDNKVYKASVGLMELLVKKEPNENLITEEDFKNYGDILHISNAIRQRFDPNTKRLNSDTSKKWKIIKANYPQLFETTKVGAGLKDKNKEIEEDTGNVELIMLPSDTNTLAKMLKLSVLSYQAGNNGEYNKINVLLEELKRKDVMTLDEYEKIYKNVFNTTSSSTE